MLSEGKLVTDNDSRLGSGKPSSDKRRRKRTALTILAVAIAATLTATLLVAPPTPTPGHQILKAGDSLRYSVSGSFNNTSFSYTDGLSITISDATELGLSRLSVGHGYGLIPHMGHDFEPYLGTPNERDLVGTEQTSTPFGDKYVKMLGGFDTSNYEVVVVYIGIDSHLVYRWTVSSISKDYHYTYELAETNNARVSSVDTTMRTVSVKDLSTPAPKQCSFHSFGNFTPGSGSAYCYGSVQAGQGQQIHYALGGNVSMYVLDINNLKDISANGYFRFREDLSRLAGNPGDTNVTVEPGIYRFLVVCKGSDQTVEFHGEQVSGYFIAYFGLKGQDY